MIRIKYLGGLPAKELAKYTITPEVDHIIEVADDLADTLLAAFPAAFISAGARAVSEAPADRMVKGAPQNRGRV